MKALLFILTFSCLGYFSSKPSNWDQVEKRMKEFLEFESKVQEGCVLIKGKGSTLVLSELPKETKKELVVKFYDFMMELDVAVTEVGSKDVFDIIESNKFKGSNGLKCSTAYENTIRDLTQVSYMAYKECDMPKTECLIKILQSRTESYKTFVHCLDSYAKE